MLNFNMSVRELAIKRKRKLVQFEKISLSSTIINSLSRRLIGPVLFPVGADL